MSQWWQWWRREDKELASRRQEADTKLAKVLAECKPRDGDTAVDARLKALQISTAKLSHFTQSLSDAERKGLADYMRSGKFNKDAHPLHSEVLTRIEEISRGC